MPQNTRPRIVQTPDTYMTPPFNPEAADPRKMVESILQPAYQPAPPSTGLLENILNSLAQGVAIGTSQSPGDALRQTLQQKAQQKFEQEQARQQFNQRLDLMGREFGLRETANQLDERRLVGREQRQQDYREKERQSEFDLYLKKNGIEFQQQQELTRQQQDYRKAAMVLEHQWDLEKQSNADARFDRQQTRLENKDLFDKKISLITAGIPAGLANKIASKMYNGEDLTKEESSVITSAARRQLALASGGGRRSSSGSVSSGLTAKQMFQYMNVRMKDQFVVVKNADGSEAVVEMSNAPKDSLTGEIQGFVRIANAQEKMSKLSEEVGAIESLLSPQEQAKANNQPIKSDKPGANGSPYFGPEIPQEFLQSPAITPEQKAAAFYRSQYDALLKQGASPKLAEKLLREKVVSDAPQDQVIIDGIFNKGKGKTLKDIKAQSSGKIKSN